jgi:dihydroxyacetone synthase
MPNILYIRLGDSEETAGAWTTAIKAKHTPSIISTSRHALPQLKETWRDCVRLGAYVLQEVEGDQPADLTLIGVGAELSHALGVAAKLRQERAIRVRVVSFPSWRLFEQQSIEYKRSVLQRHRGVPAVVIEPVFA